MKAILFFSFLFFSTLTNAGLFTPQMGGASNPQGGWYYGCSEFSCTEGYKDPYVFEGVFEDGGHYSDQYHFAHGNDLVDREMSTGTSYSTTGSHSLLIEWVTFDVFNARLAYPGGRLDLPGTGSGSFMYELVSESPYIYMFGFGIIGMANSLDSFVEYGFTAIQPPSEVPLPASIFLLVPALLGFMGLRRKRS